MDSEFIILSFVTFGFVSGFFVGIASGTAGIIIIPFLTTIINQSIHKSIGTSLVIDVIIGLVAGLVYVRKGKTLLKPGSILVLMGMIGAFIGSMFTSATRENDLNLIIGTGLIIIGVSFVKFGLRQNVEVFRKTVNISFFLQYKKFTFLILGIIIGLISGYSGLGGGGFVAFTLILILGYELHIAIGTSLLMMSVIAGSASIIHIINNEFYIDGIFPLLASAGIGAFCGALFANKVNEDILGRIIGIVIIILGISMFIRLCLQW